VFNLYSSLSIYSFFLSSQSVLFIYNCTCETASTSLANVTVSLCYTMTISALKHDAQPFSQPQ